MFELYKCENVVYCNKEILNISLLAVLLARWKNDVPAAKCVKQLSSRVTDVSIGGFMSASTDDSDTCEVEWDSPKPLSGNFFTSVNVNHCKVYDYVNINDGSFENCF